MLNWILNLYEIVRTRNWDSWGTLYVSSFEKQLHEIRADLKKKANWPFSMRISQARKCAVFRWGYSLKEVAELRIHGECCMPTNAIVNTNLSEELRTVFTKAIQLPMRFEPLEA